MAEPSHMCDWNSGLAGLDALDGDVHQRPHEAVEFLHRAVVGVQCDVDGVFLRRDVGELGQATAPVTMSLTYCPDANPHLPRRTGRSVALSLGKTTQAAMMDCDDVTLMAG